MPKLLNGLKSFGTDLKRSKNLKFLSNLSPELEELSFQCYSWTDAVDDLNALILGERPSWRESMKRLRIVDFRQSGEEMIECIVSNFPHLERLELVAYQRYRNEPYSCTLNRRSMMLLAKLEDFTELHLHDFALDPFILDCTLPSIIRLTLSCTFDIYKLVGILVTDWKKSKKFGGRKFQPHLDIVPPIVAQFPNLKRLCLICYDTQGVTKWSTRMERAFRDKIDNVFCFLGPQAGVPKYYLHR